MTLSISKNYFREIKSLIFGRKKPQVVSVNITERCNQKCIYCEIGQSIPSTEKYSLSFQDMIWIIDEMSKSNIKKISICGGEPFLFTRLIEMVLYASKSGIRCFITSNGMSINKLSDDSLKILKQCNAQINISIDSFDENINSYIRGSKASVHNVISSIEKLSEFGITVILLSVISKYNYNKLYDYIRKAVSLGVAEVLFQPVIKASNYPDRKKIEEKDFINVDYNMVNDLQDELRKILLFEGKNKIKTNAYRLIPWISYYLKNTENDLFFNNILKKFYCRDLYAIINISYAGIVQPCALYSSDISIIGNRSFGLVGMWNTATIEIREKIRIGDIPLNCNGCSHHFSRNMIASIIKNPLKNITALRLLFRLLIGRIYFRAIKKIKYAYR